MSDHNYEGALYERAGAAVVRANKLAEKTRKDFEKCVVLVVVYYCSMCRSVSQPVTHACYCSVDAGAGTAWLARERMPHPCNEGSDSL
jgi:hypothetical protein